MNLGAGRPTTDLDPQTWPLLLARLQRESAVGSVLDKTVSSTVLGALPVSGNGYLISGDDLLIGGGFVPMEGLVDRTDRRWVRADTLPDWVGPGMRVLIVGLNPSPTSAADGVSFARPGNRFWPAALASGLVSVGRDPEHALTSHGLGFTDLVKRTTRTAAEVTPSEFRTGADRLGRLLAWLQPAACVIVGLMGWRAAVDKQAVAGWQATAIGGARVYLMPNTSGLNAHSRIEDFISHLTVVAEATSQG